MPMLQILKRDCGSVLVVVVLRRLLCEVSAETLVGRCGTICACARAPAPQTITIEPGGEKDPAGGGYAHPPPRFVVF